MNADAFAYQGQELDMLAHAERWKRYWGRSISRWIGGDVLEVGAGLGVNTRGLQTGRVRSWICLEPDPGLAERTSARVSPLPHCSVRTGTIADCAAERFDTILYIDVLEHIKADGAELGRAASLLRGGGRIVVLSPAHQFLFSPFDAGIGHYRRYNMRTLRAVSPGGCVLTKMFYLDSAGMLLSLANRLLLRQSKPTLKQIQVWDRYVIPISKTIDPVLRHRFGKTIVGVWTRG